MDVRGQRVLIVGDSLTARGSSEQVNVTEPPNRASSSPGDLLASWLLVAGQAEAARINARVSRSAWNFWQREATTQLLAADAAWRPTQVFVMLGTNDIGLNMAKDAEAMTKLRDAYRAMGAEVWGIGPPTFARAELQQGTEAVVTMLRKVFGKDRVIDARPLSVDLVGATFRTGDQVHFTRAGAAALAQRLAGVILAHKAGGLTRLKPLGLGLGVTLGLGLLGLGVVWIARRRSQLGAPTIAVKTSQPWADVGDDMDVHEWQITEEDEIDGVELRSKFNPEHYALAHRATTGGRWQVTWFDARGPWGDVRRKTLHEALTEAAPAWEYDVTAIHAKSARKPALAGDEDYRMAHRPSQGPRLFDLLEDDVLPPDVYTHPHFYTGYTDKAYLAETLRAITAARGKPEAMVTIYRAAPKGTKRFNPGDWVTLSRAYAAGHAKHPTDPKQDMQIFKARVPARSVRFAGDDLMEYGYWGDAIKPTLGMTQAERHHEIEEERTNPTVDIASRLLAPLLGANVRYVPVRKLFVDPDKLASTITDVREGRTSYSHGQPLEVSRLDSPRGAFYVIDGHHRLVELMQRGTASVPITISAQLPRIERTGGGYRDAVARKVPVKV